MWHVSNEYACHNIPCYCDTCAAGFRVWLRAALRRRSTRLNDAWGTAFWSQRYTDWEQVLPPRLTTTFANPTHVAGLQAVPVRHPAGLPPQREGDPRRPVPRCPGDHQLHDAARTSTTSTTTSGRRSRTSSAPTTTSSPSLEHPQAELAFSGDLTRGLAGGAPVAADGALDQRGQLAAGQPGQGPRPARCATASPTWRGAPTPSASSSGGSPGRGRRSSTPPWCRTPAATAPGSARSCELGARGRAARRGHAAPASRPRSRSSGTTRPSGPRTDRRCRRARCSYPTTAHAVHRVLRDRGITADVVHPSADLTAYQVVVVPTLYLVTRRARRGRRGGGRGRRAGAGHLLLRHQRRATTTSGSAATPARSATCSACASRSSSRSCRGEHRRARGRRHRHAVERGRHRRRRRGPRPVCRGPPRRAPGRHPARHRRRGRVVPQHPARRRGPRRRCVDQVHRGRRRRRRGADVPPGVEAVRRRGDGRLLALPRQRHRRARRRSPSSGHDLVADRPVGPTITARSRARVAVVRED